MPLVNVIVGIFLLALGRKLFWLFVGCIGFIAGYTSVQQFAGGQSDLIVLLIALIIGLVGALLAVFFQGVAIALAGFIAGGYISIIIAGLLGFSAADQLIWIVSLIGGILGAVLLFILFEWALILISSLSGASLIVQTTELGSDMKILLFIVLVIFGTIFQAVLLTQNNRSEKGN